MALARIAPGCVRGKLKMPLPRALGCSAGHARADRTLAAQRGHMVGASSSSRPAEVSTRVGPFARTRTYHGQRGLDEARQFLANDAVAILWGELGGRKVRRSAYAVPKHSTPRCTLRAPFGARTMSRNFDRSESTSLLVR